MKRRSKIALVVALVLLLATTAFVIGISASDNTPSLSVTGANVSFQETVHLWYAVGHENISNPDAIKLLVWREGSISNVSECVLGSQNYTLGVVGEVNEGTVQGKTFEFAGLAASEMTENVYARAYVEEDGEIIYSPVVKYSILQYALNKTGVTGTISPNEHLRKMLKEMLEYGAAAQLYFDPDTTAPLATDDFVKIAVKDATLPDGTTSGIFKVGTEVKLIASPTAENPYVLWKDENGNLLSAKEAYTFTAKKNITCTATISNEASSFGLYDHVVIVGLDGAGSWFKDIDTPNMDRIFGNTEDSLEPGALTYNMRVTSPTSSAPSWLSFFHGVNPEHHGINENYVVEGTPFPTDSKFPSFLRVIAEENSDAKLASIATWSGINVGIVEDGFGIYKFRGSDASGTTEAVNYINQNNDLEVLYVHLNDPDAVGHNKTDGGYGTENYLNELATVDEQIGTIYDALVANNMVENTLFIVTTDHGGLDNSHGGLSDQEKYVVFGAAGKTVDAGFEKIENMEIRDCASIVLYALGYQQPETYTSRVPTGVFEGIEASARPVYHDPDNPRDVVSKPTPSLGTEGSVENFVNNELITYLPFDGNTTEIKGNAPATEYGKIVYEEGYFGEAVKVDDGYVSVGNFDPGYASFTISLWMKSPSAHGYSPLLTTNNWGNANKGIGLWLIRDTIRPHYMKVNAAGESGTALIDYNQTLLPEDYFHGWMHVLVIVDRENGTMSLCFDFGEIYTVDSTISRSMTVSEGLINIGQALSGTWGDKCGLSVDELMIFDGAFTRNDINDLTAYYGKTPVIPDTEEVESEKHVAVPTPEDAMADINALIPNKDLDIFFDFDGNTASGNPAYPSVQKGTMIYRDGFRGQSYRPGLGYVQIPDYKFGKDSFTIAFWMNCSAINGTTTPIISTQDMSNGVGQGFSLILSGEYKQFIFKMGDETNRVVKQFTIPEGFYGSWNHITISVDRVNKTVRLFYNFVELPVIEINKNNNLFCYDNSGVMYPADSTVDGLEGSYLTIGQDGQGDFSLSLKTNLDELMIWDDALTALDVSLIGEYYFPKPTIEEVTGLQPGLHLDFNGTISNKVDGNSAPTAGNVTNYVEGFLGSAADLNGSYGSIDTGTNNGGYSPENYVYYRDFKLCDGNASSGYNSVTFSMWLKFSDAITSSTGDKILFSTADGNDREHVPGISVLMYGSAIKVTADMLPAYINSSDCTFDTDGYAMRNGEYIYRQLFVIRATAEVLNSNGEYYNDNYGAFVFATPSEWTHLVFVYDRGQYSVDDGKYVIYQNGNIAPINGSYTSMTMGNIIEDQADFNGVGLMINDDVGHMSNSLRVHLDEFVVFKKALTAAEIYQLYDYYVPQPQIEDYLDKAPDYYFSFNGSVVNKGDESLSFSEGGTISYNSGILASSADFSKGYVKLDEDYKLGKDSFTVGFWINTAMTSGDPLILSNGNFTSSTNDGFSLVLNGGKILFNMASGTQRVRTSFSLPENYSGQWIYVLCVVDRENSEYKISYNFGEFQTASMYVYENNSKDVSGFDADSKVPLHIGQDGEGDYGHKLVAYLDEFMIWREALDEEDLAALQSYFNQ